MRTSEKVLEKNPCGCSKNSALFKSMFQQPIPLLGGGFKYFLFSPIFGEYSHFDLRIFFRWVGGSTTNQLFSDKRSYPFTDKNPGWKYSDFPICQVREELAKDRGEKRSKRWSRAVGAITPAPTNKNKTG